MSYESPKYINKSNADLFQKMQDKIDSAVLTSKKTIAAENYKNNLIKNQNIVAAGNASATFIKDMNAKDYGGKFNQGVVSGFYDSYEGPDGEITTWAERVKNITMQMNQNPKPENYGELQTELDFINGSPAAMQTGLENLASQFNTEGRDVDLTSASNPLLAAQVIMGKPGFEPGKSNFKMDVKMNKTTNPPTYDYVFTGSMTDASGNEVKFEPSPYVVNSQDLADYEDQDKEFIPGIPSETLQVSENITESNILDGVTFDKKGNITDFGKLDIHSLRMPGATADDTNSKEYIDPNLEPPNNKFRVWDIDKAELRRQMIPTIDLNVLEFTSPTGGDLQDARAFWNNKLATRAASQPYDVNLIREAMGEFPEVAKMSDDEVKDLWEESTSAWPSDLTKLNKYQELAFKRLYTDLMVDETYKLLESNIEQRKTTISAGAITSNTSFNSNKQTT
mgnify:CR=1 FL=1